MSDKSQKQKECKEYNTLKYKTMIMTGQNLDTKIDNETSMDDLNTYLMKEMNENKLALERGIKGEIAEDFIGGLKKFLKTTTLMCQMRNMMFLKTKLVRLKK